MPHVWNHPAGEEQEQWSGGTHGYGGITGFYGEGLEYPGQATGECPPGQVWNARWNECQTAPPTYGGQAPPPGGTITPPQEVCAAQGGTWNWYSNQCNLPDVGPASVEEIFSEYNCPPGEMYQNAQGESRYCPAGEGSSYLGLSTEESWAAQGNPLLDILSQNPTFLQNFDTQELMSMFPDLGPQNFDIAREGLLNTMSGFRQDKGVQRRTMGDVLRGGAMESGQELASSGFAGGGAYGMQGGKERKKTLRDYRQSMQDINLSMGETQSEYEEAINEMRLQYTEGIQGQMAGLISSDLTQWAADEQCDPGEIFWGGSCTPIELTDFDVYAEDIDWG